jgi:hypothetical protein
MGAELAGVFTPTGGSDDGNSLGFWESALDEFGFRVVPCEMGQGSSDSMGT